jgi:hypothetical protein
MNGNSRTERAIARAHLGRVGATGSIEDQLARLRRNGHTVATTVAPDGTRTLVADGVTYHGATLADCLLAAGLA